MHKIGILTGGGDCPGLNAVIRAVAKTAASAGSRVVGFLDGYSGLVEGRWVELEGAAVSGILHRGGTILGTNNRDNPFHFPVRKGTEVTYQDLSRHALQIIEELGLSALVAVGGDGSLAIARELHQLGAPMVGVPKTIDNDLAATDQTFGFDTAVATVTDALDKLHTTAESHHRVMVLEVMGRYAGWIALASGLAGGADVILIPEIPWQPACVIAQVERRKQMGKTFSLVVVAEGVRAPSGELVASRTVEGSVEPLRLGGIGHLVGELIERQSGAETRVTVLGHIQRGGSPTSYDRILATRYGVAAAELALAGSYGQMVALRGQEIVPVPLAEATARLRTVPPDHPLVLAARATGVSLGDRD